MAWSVRCRSGLMRRCKSQSKRDTERETNEKGASIACETERLLAEPRADDGQQDHELEAGSRSRGLPDQQARERAQVV